MDIISKEERAKWRADIISKGRANTNEIRIQRLINGLYMAETIQAILAKELSHYAGSCPADRDEYSSDPPFEHCATGCTDNEAGECYVLRAEKRAAGA